MYYNLSAAVSSPYVNTNNILFTAHCGIDPAKAFEDDMEEDLGITEDSKVEVPDTRESLQELKRNAQVGIFR